MFRISSVVSETGARGGILWLCWVRFGGKVFFFLFLFYSNFYPFSVSLPEGREGRKTLRRACGYDMWCVTVTEILN